MKKIELNNIKLYSKSKDYRYYLKLYYYFLYIYPINYGYLSNNKQIIMKDWSKQYKEFKKHYKYLSLENVEKYKIGICFDFVNYLYILYSNNINSKFYLMFITGIKINNNKNINIFKYNDEYDYFSHSFIINEYNNKLLLLCSDYKYIIECNNIKELIKNAIENLLITNQIKHNKKNIYILITNYKDKDYGKTYNEFIQKRIENKNIKININEYNFKKDKLLIKF